MRVIRSSLLTQSAILSAMLAAVLPASAGHAQDAGPEASDGNDEIVVTGTRLSLRAATAEKRNADNFVEALQANDVGKLPDQNVAEAVKRLPGLSVANDQGEGRYVIIRGIDPNLINVRLNDQTLPAPEPGARQVKLDDLPSAMIQSITVTKSLLASQDANAIGGEVNIRTKSAFDSSARFFFDARGAVGHYAMNKQSPWEADATVGGRFGTDEQFGAVVSVNYSRRPIESENFQGTTGWKVNNGINTPDQGGLRDYNLVRKRLGVVGNFDWRPNDAVKLYIRSSYSEFSDNEVRDQNLLDGFATTTPTGSFTARGSVLTRRRREDDNTKSVTVGGDFDLGGGQKLAVSGGWTKAEKIDPLRSEFRFRTGSGAVSGTYDISADPFIFTPFSGPDLTKYTFDSLNIETRQAFESIMQGRADYTVPVSDDGRSTIQIGAKYLERIKRNNQDRTNFGKVSGPTGSASFQLNSVAYTGDPSFYDGRYGFGPRIDYDAALAYVNAHPNVAAVNKSSSISASLANDSRAKEEIFAAYVMATIRLGNLTLIPGVRYEHTHDYIKAKVVNANATLGDDYNSFGTNSYDNIFPGLNAKYALMDGVTLRGAITTAIGRPNYASLAPFVTVDTGASPTAISLGNPGLKPYLATNFDAAIEYYPNKDSVFSAGAFHKIVKNPIYASMGTETNATYAGITYPAANVSRFINADTEIVTGVEFNAQTQFTFLPGFLGGFGISANYTHVWGHARAASVRAGDLPLAFQSADSGNAQIFFEKYGLAARVAVNYRSAYLDTLAPAGSTAAQDQYTDANAQLDVHVSYQIIPQVTIFGDATNLTDAPWRRYLGTKPLLIERERYGAQVRGGIQVHF